MRGQFGRSLRILLSEPLRNLFGWKTRQGWYWLRWLAIKWIIVDTLSQAGYNELPPEAASKATCITSVLSFRLIGMLFYVQFSFLFFHMRHDCSFCHNLPWSQKQRLPLKSQIIHVVWLRYVYICGTVFIHVSACTIVTLLVTVP